LPQDSVCGRLLTESKIEFCLVLTVFNTVCYAQKVFFPFYL